MPSLNAQNPSLESGGVGYGVTP